MIVTRAEVERAAYAAIRHHTKKYVVRSFLEDWEDNISLLLTCINDRTYVEHLNYRKLEKIGNNGKKRDIDSPTLITRILQYIFINKITPLYEAKDNMTGLNCKEGCGLNSKTKNKSVRHRIKSMFYDRRDINYVAIVDQRKCYAHVKVSRFRKALKFLTKDTELIDFGCNVTFVGGVLPIGTPVSPLAHHILMLQFDLDMARSYSFYIRYADNIMIGCNNKQEACQALWRVKLRWWYELGIRANRWESRVMSINGTAIDFCGTVYHRNPDKGYDDHNKGYAKIRQSTAEAAKKATQRNWGCYLGQLVGLDTFNLLKSIEKKNMKLAELTNKVKIDRRMDAPQVLMKDVVDIVIDVLDYEIRQNGKGQDNWIKLLISLDEVDESKSPTGKRIVRETHGDYQGLYMYIRKCERTYGNKQNILPIEDAKIINSCGYIFEGSTNQINYLEEYLNKKQN